MTVRIEISPSNRASCRFCWKKIKKGEIRFREDGGTGYYPTYYHEICWIQRHTSFISDLMKLIGEDFQLVEE